MGIVGYLLLGMLESIVFRVIRDALPGNPVGQERILGASLLAMGIADVSSFQLNDSSYNFLSGNAVSYPSRKHIPYA